MHSSFFLMSSGSVRGNIRLATVINKIPFYLSSGDNSNQPGTWLPFLGIAKNNWIVKPSRSNKKTWPKQVEAFIEKLDQSSFSFTRFGTFQTMCISAALGGGYWLTRDGKSLKNCLRPYLEQYFQTVENFPSQGKLDSLENNLEKLIGYKDINEKLAGLGAIVILNSFSGILPFPGEEALYTNAEIRQLMIKLDNQELFKEYRYLLQDSLCLEILLIFYEENYLDEFYINLVVALKDQNLLKDVLSLLKDPVHRKGLSELTSLTEITNYIKRVNACYAKNQSILYSGKETRETKNFPSNQDEQNKRDYTS